MKTVEDLLNAQRLHIEGAAKHEDAILEARKRLADIQRKRGDREHLEAVLAKKTDAIRFDDKLSQEEVVITREISSRSGLAADSRRLADLLTAQIEDVRFVATTDLVQAQSANVARFTKQARPQLDSFATLVQTLQSDGLDLIEHLKSLPDPAPRQIKTIVDRLQSLFSRALLAEMSKIFKLAVIGFPAVPGDFDDMTEEFFSGLQRALSTLAATRAAGGEGRKLYRCVGHISGISGGLQARDTDVFALLENDPETKKFVSTGALVEISAGGQKASAA